MYCAQCGNQVATDDRVCTRCGAGLLEPHAVRTSAVADAGTSPIAVTWTAPRTTPEATRLSDSQVWDRFMRPAVSSSGPVSSGPVSPDPVSSGSASSGRVEDVEASDDMATTALPIVDAETRTLSGVPAEVGPVGRDDSGHQPLDRTRVMPVVAVSTPGLTGSMPAEWFRSGATQSAEPTPASLAAGRAGTPVERPRRRRVRLVVVLCVVALVAVLVGGLFLWRQVSTRHDATPGTGSSSAGAGASVAASPAANASNCGGGVWASADTSCEFARVVADKARGNSAATFQLQATSPVTGTRYTMSCTAHPKASGGAMTVCTGGRAAAVWLRST